MRHRSTQSAGLFAVVVLAFFFPFYEVSCRGKPVAEATGYELATGNVEAPRGQEQASVPWLILVPVLAIAGGALVVAARRAPARASGLFSVAVGAGVAITVLLVVSYLHLRARIRGEVGDPSSAMGSRLASMVTVTPLVGWYVSFACGVGAAILARLAGVQAAQAAPPGDALEASTDPSA